MNADFMNRELPFDEQLDKKTLDWFEPYHIKYKYNAELVDCFVSIAEKMGFNVTDEQKKNTGRFVYVARSRLRDRQKTEEAEKLIKEGWKRLTCEDIKELSKEKKKILVNGKASIDWFSFKVNEVFKPFYSESSGAFLMKPRARTRGIRFHGLSDQANWFYKTV